MKSMRRWTIPWPGDYLLGTWYTANNTKTTMALSTHDDIGLRNPVIFRKVYSKIFYPYGSLFFFFFIFFYPTTLYCLALGAADRPRLTGRVTLAVGNMLTVGITLTVGRISVVETLTVVKTLTVGKTLIWRSVRPWRSFETSILNVSAYWYSGRYKTDW